MIVNTTVLNFRFALGTLIVALFVLAAYGFSNYSALKSDADFLMHEKKLLQQELNKVIVRYDELGLKNDSLKSKFETAKQRAQSAFDSLDKLKIDVSVLTQVQSELMFLRRQNKKIESDSMNRVVEKLQQEKVEITRSLIQQEQDNAELRSVNEDLESSLEGGSQIMANSIRAKVFWNDRSGKMTETDKANKAEIIDVCFVLSENPLAEKGDKDLYVQILGPDSNVVNDLGAVEFGEQLLIYSSKINVEYRNRAKEICVEIPNNMAFNSGVYLISVFENERRLGGTQIELN
ncbi:MAG: hypothetical protein HKN00_02030 [Flavobacteriaceae bacterium]|nr:hypothetical protein [Bacteroidia bacterium]MBT8287710.1 hypothetical protein [Bacteroidia bacterium]NNF73933.1 hypothetical protein [Flavobacteriaceae bacterium]NNK72356.1 hypothetical protein [Flavobacteriaceae bacterium]